MGLSYTLNRVSCCQLLLRRSKKLDDILAAKGFRGAPQGPLQGLDVRFKAADTAAAAAAAGSAAAAATAADDLLPPQEFADAAGELLE